VTKKIIPRTNKHGIPPGYLMGRLPGAGVGPVQLINLQGLQGFGVATAAQAAAGSAVHGFTFSITGQPSAGQVIGIATFPYQMTFVSADPGDVANSTVAATSSAAFDIQVQVSGIWTTIGTITWSAGGTTGAVAFSGGTWVLPAATQFRVLAPNPKDATLADIAARVQGVSG
jgi:hypothetical protein